ncbi:hypothetical protein N9N67_01360 [Bacteriovoracaceae bacterium]|nr:hypothetical protein [Bacteriovoracaceae bacterium]
MNLNRYLCLGFLILSFSSHAYEDVIIKRFLKLYPKIETAYGVKELKIKKSFSDRFEMHASFDQKNQPFIQYSAITIEDTQHTPNAFVLLLCHELGHFLGGPPYKITAKGSPSWSSSEGQADYYATAVCLKKYYETFTPLSKIQMKSAGNLNQESGEVDDLCADSNIKFCREMLSSSLKLSQVFAKYAHFPYPLSLKEKDFYQTNKTILSYPNPQCRLDTLVAGAFCKNKTFEECQKSLSEISARPTCWFVH